MPAKIVKAAFPGHVVHRPDVWRAPYIFASPHSGRDYPGGFVKDSVLDLRALRRSEDAYVDLLLPAAEALGIPVQMARFPRAFVDVNRSSREIDEYMFTGSPVNGTEIRSNRVLAGFGAIPRYAAEGRAIYARKLPASEGRSRIQWCYEPYHESLKSLVDECLSVFGTAILIDWHSMPSTAGGNPRNLPDIVLGDRYGVACDQSVTVAWEEAFQAQGFSVSRNVPYAGGHVTALYGQPSKGVHVLQVEINRQIYLNEQAVTRARGRFSYCQNQISKVAETIISAASLGHEIAAE